jgi:hypothetical protein
MSNFRRAVAVAAAIGLVSSSIAMADPLAAGKPAGVKQAQTMDSIPPLVWIAVAGILAAGIAAATSSGNSQSTFTTVAPSTTS